MSQFLLTPPSTVESFGQYDRISDPLWRWMRADVALSLVKIDGVWQTARLSSYPDLDALEGYYQGGHTYSISLETAIELVADGFAAYLEEIPDPPEPDPEPQGYDEMVLSVDPVFYFKLDDTDPSATVTDAAGNGLNSLAVDAGNTQGPALASNVDNSLSAAALSTAVSGDLLAPVSDIFTLEMWVQQPASDGGVVSIGLFDDTDSAIYVLLDGTGFGAGTEKFWLFNTDGDDFQVVTDVGVDDGEIHHVVIRCASNVVEAWIDGVARGGFPFTGTVTLRYFRIGDGTQTAPVYWNNVTFYDTFMSEADIVAHYEAGQIV